VGSTYSAAVGLLKAGLSELRVANQMHLSLETVQQLKQEKILEQEIQCDHQVEKG
jgi:orotate phosphoribosyltransferase-like protein